MHRGPVLALLAAHVTRAEPGAEAAALREILAFVRAEPECLERRCAPGHLTGSAWIVSPCRRRVLLTHHHKLDRWLQLGGHADGDGDLLAVARREAEEESGLAGLRVVSPHQLVRAGQLDGLDDGRLHGRRLGLSAEPVRR
jgi:8-oxo-dGTP pyrophosphatase MutT (NUDIX family)